MTNAPPAAAAAPGMFRRGLIGYLPVHIVQGVVGILAGRVKAAALEDFSAWEFYANGEWQPDFRKATHLADHLGAELSVSYLPRF